MYVCLMTRLGQQGRLPGYQTRTIKGGFRGKYINTSKISIKHRKGQGFKNVNFTLTHKNNEENQTIFLMQTSNFNLYFVSLLYDKTTTFNKLIRFQDREKPSIKLINQDSLILRYHTWKGCGEDAHSRDTRAADTLFYGD